MRPEELRDRLTLTYLRGFGPKLINSLLAHFGTAATVLGAGPEQIRRVEGVGEKLARSFADKVLLGEARQRAEQELARAARHKITLYSQESEFYPALLKDIHDPPVILHTRGTPQCLTAPTVAIIGSRAASSYGKRISFELARELASFGITIVSGMALGIDSEAHRGALAGGGLTAAVLGCGLDIVYPQQNVKLYQHIQERGLLITEYHLGTRPEGFRFPARNRIISGISLGVVVVEATLKSGSLITAGLALEQGREVFAVPGRIDSLKSAGTHRLLQQGAHLVHNAEDIVAELKLALSLQQISGREGDALPASPPTAPEFRLLGLLDTYPTTIDEIVRRSGLPPGHVHDLLLRLEIKGLVRQVPGQQYERVT